MLLVDFIKKYNDWEDRLQQKPYCITVKRKENLAIFTYSQIESDFSNPLARECRGVILDIDTLVPVCVPFYKFGNYGEAYVPNIDWSTARVQEKVDGSLIKVWYYNGTWNVSTNGTIDARDASLDSDIFAYKNFAELFTEAAHCSGLDYSKLDRHCTYMFELMSPFNRVVVPHQDIKICHIGTRNNATLREDDVDIGIEKPKSYKLASLEECIKAASILPFSNEGYVVVDRNWNRIKIKSPAYVAAHHLKNNGVINRARVVSMLKQNEQDEFLSYYPEYKSTFDNVKNLIESFVINMSAELDKVRDTSMRRKEFAEIAKQTICPAFMFSWIDGKAVSVREWLYAQSEDKIVYWITRDTQKEGLIK